MKGHPNPNPAGKLQQLSSVFYAFEHRHLHILPQALLLSNKDYPNTFTIQGCQSRSILPISEYFTDPRISGLDPRLTLVFQI